MANFDVLIPVGRTFISPGRTISEGDFTLLTSLTWNTTIIHTDKVFMKQTPFGERILDGPSLLACAAGLSHRSGYHEATHNEHLRTVANLGYDNVRFLAPVKPGDTITIHTTITHVRASQKNPKRAILTIQDVVFNQEGQQVLTDQRALLVELTP
jgi:acyl dehydratase